MREWTTSRVTAADRPYCEFYDFYSVSPEKFGSTLVSVISVICGLPWPEKNLENWRNKLFVSFKTRAKRERAVTWWTPAAQMLPVFDSSSFVPVPTVPRKFATILLLAFSLFELVATLSQCLCSETNKKDGEVGEYPQ